jgi:hypothetical protein
MTSDFPDTYVSRSRRGRAIFRAAAAIGGVSSTVSVVQHDQSFADEIKSAPDLTMPDSVARMSQPT